LIATSLVSLAVQHPGGSAVFYLIDGTPADSPFAGQLARVARAVPHETRNVEFRAVPDAINTLAKELEKRQAANHNPAHDPAVYVLIYGLQRFRVLRKTEDEFSFSLSSSDDDGGAAKPANTGKQFADLLRDGPAVGIHVLAWADTAVAVDRTLDRGSLREFDHRVLFQMSAADSSTLIDSPAANKLGFHRALAYSEEQGVMEKFRPYALPDQAWLERVRAALWRTSPTAARG
jgi:DNA segregation ATPase FtsK/SpoIIIE, S-DNA-T family